MRVACYHSQPHYEDHLRPIAQAMGCPVDWWSTGFLSSSGRSTELTSWADLHAADVTMVAGYVDAARLAEAGVPVVLVEHGAGQSYDGDDRSRGHGSYSGGAGLDHVVGFICPSVRVAERWRALYDVPSWPVGCPRLDPWHNGQREVQVGPTVAISFHWDCQIIPETRSAWPAYDEYLPGIVAELRNRGWRVLGHGHPRIAERLRRRWRALGVEWASYPEVLDAASVLVCDNSSLQMESAAVGIRQVVLDAPWYRRDVDHGMRFWTHADMGPRVEDPSEVVDAVEWAHQDGPGFVKRREAAVADTYYACDGRASERAAVAIGEVAAWSTSSTRTRSPG